MNLPIRIAERPDRTQAATGLVDEILDSVAFMFGVTPGEIIGTDRSKSIKEARLAAYLVARRCTRMSYPEIARAMSKLDHTTVLSGVRSAERLALSDAWFGDAVRILVERFLVRAKAVFAE